MENSWKKWGEIHDTPDQCKRIASAKKADCTPVSFDVSNREGTFSGSHGIYKTTLEFCQCVDFIRRRLPCKHMYRLAMECGIIDATGVKSDSKQIKAPGPTPAQRKQALLQVVDMLESYDDSIQDSIREIIYCSNTDKPFMCENISMYQKPIDDGILEAVRDNEFAIKSHTQKHTLEKLESAGFVFPE